MQKEEWRMKKLRPGILSLLLLALFPAGAPAGDVAALARDRTAIEQVYYNHRLGNKPPFEQVSPPSLIERLVKDDLRKETALQRTYHVEITPALLQGEVNRINTTTRAPEMLAEIKAALGNDPIRFANAFARPMLVERLLRDRFENDDALHLALRQEVEAVRSQLTNTAAQLRGSRPVLRSITAEGRREEAPSLKSEIGNRKSEIRQSLLTPAATNDWVGDLVAILQAGHSNEVSETAWQLGARPAETNAPDPDLIEVQKRFGPDAQILSSPRAAAKDRKLYFEDMPADLRRVLQAQLRQPGDVSAVIETPGGFLLYVCEERTAGTLRVAALTRPKRGYEQWLNGPSDNP
jgi:hypothetical protein